ncbi:MAG TPA: AAA family ATPase, partial [Planctomycetes bacterium]|nr:AAA family ATPase [Planctomycetota bacterium]
MPIASRQDAAAAAQRLTQELGTVIVGQERVVEEVLVALSA